MVAVLNISYGDGTISFDKVVSLEQIDMAMKKKPIFNIDIYVYSTGIWI